MTPISPGSYEFKADSLIEIRKRIGISQSRMAELLGVPANTLSRWETGNTAPDATALAAIYSLGKKTGISEMPPFFGVRSSPLEVKIGSKATGPLVDSLSIYRSFGSYLQTQIDLTGPELAPIMKIEIRNMAPATSNWPKIVFTGVGLSLAHSGGDAQALLPSRLKTRMSRPAEVEPISNAATPWQYDPKRENLLKVAFSRLDQKEFPDITTDEGHHGEVLFPGQSLVYEIDVTSELLPYLQVKTEGTVSRRHLFHCEETFAMPENITKPLALRAFNDLNTVRTHDPLDYVIGLMPKFDGNTLLEEVQIFSKAISDGISRIKVTQEEINRISRQHKFSWFRAHLRDTFIYLDRVNSALSFMKETIGSNSPDKIGDQAGALLALKREADLLDQETQELMRSQNITREELSPA